MSQISLLLVNGVDRKRHTIRSELEAFPELKIVKECRSLSEALQFIDRSQVDVVCLSPVIRWQLKFLSRSGQRLSIPVIYIDWYAEMDGCGFDEMQNIRRKQYFQAVREKLRSVVSVNSQNRGYPGSINTKEPVKTASFVLLAGLNGDFDITRSILSDLHQMDLPIVIAQKLNSCFAYHYTKQLDQVSNRRTHIAKGTHVLNSCEVLLGLLDRKIEFIQAEGKNAIKARSSKGNELGAAVLLEKLLSSMIECEMTGLVVFMPETVSKYSGIIGDLQDSGLQTIFIKPWKRSDQESLLSLNSGLVEEMVPIQQLKNHLLTAARDSF